MSIKLMATIGYNLEISSDVNKLWDLPENERRRFKVLNYENSYVLVDRETFISDSFKVANNIFVFGDKSLENMCDVICYDSVESVCNRFEYSDDSLWIVGSTGEFYKIFMEKVDTMDITMVYDYRRVPHSYFPLLDNEQWDVECVERNENGIVYSNGIYKKRVRMR